VGSNPTPTATRGCVARHRAPRDAGAAAYLAAPLENAPAARLGVALTLASLRRQRVHTARAFDGGVPRVQQRGNAFSARRVGTVGAGVFAMALMAAAPFASAQTVLSCAADWGASSSCGGCSDLRWAEPSADPKVYSPDATYWTILSALAATARVAISSNPAGPATCQTSNLVTKASLAAGAPPPTGLPVSTTGDATLSWSLPTTRTDGAPLTNLAGTRVLAGISTSALASLTTVPAPGTSYVAKGLVNGTWYFAVESVTTTGESSAATPPAGIVVNVPTSTCPAKPTDESRTVQCVAPAVGSWTQTRTFVSSAYPTCWTPTAWSPAVAPTGACVVSATWRVAASGSATTRPAYELIRDVTDTNWIRGYQLGDVPVGRPCGAAKEIAGTIEYHRVAEADTALRSPTYRGRVLVAVCVTP
jgi:hypothetical protein